MIRSQYGMRVVLVALLIAVVALSVPAQEEGYIDGVDLNENRTETLFGISQGWARARLYHLNISGVGTFRTPIDPAYLGVDVRLEWMGPIPDLDPEGDSFVALSVEPFAGFVFSERMKEEITEIETSRDVSGLTATGTRYSVTYARTMLERLYQTSIRVDYDLTIMPSGLNHYPTVGVELFSFKSGTVPLQQEPRPTFYSDWRLFAGIGYDVSIGAQEGAPDAIGIDLETSLTADSIRWGVEATFMPFNEILVVRDVTLLVTFR